jgi:hypothetical protein
MQDPYDCGDTVDWLGPHYCDVGPHSPSSGSIDSAIQPDHIELSARTYPGRSFSLATPDISPQSSVGDSRDLHSDSSAAADVTAVDLNFWGSVPMHEQLHDTFSRHPNKTAASHAQDILTGSFDNNHGLHLPQNMLFLSSQAPMGGFKDLLDSTSLSLGNSTDLSVFPPFPFLPQITTESSGERYL